ncbi:hypothetical protein FGIG_03548 [Fasciola gigantica]|uniref:Uncharacterized protein n=1 Tax=Fasciola gigantica TaxID=46835 RepID=A0A504YQX2_FASGI|nr:hypothetical protein FGIG_03548 [Fasciola gigantica]
MRSHSAGSQCKPPRPPPPKTIALHISRSRVMQLTTVQSKPSPEWSFRSSENKQTNGDSNYRLPISVSPETTNRRSLLDLHSNKNCPHTSQHVVITRPISPPPIYPKPKIIPVTTKPKRKTSLPRVNPLQLQRSDSLDRPPSVTLADLQAHLRNFFGESQPQ